MCGLFYKKNLNKTLNESVSSQFLELGREQRQQLKDYFFVGLMLIKIAIEEYMNYNFFNFVI